MDDQALIAQWQAEEQQPFQGWDFSYLKDRWHEAQPTWSYEMFVRTLLPEADSVLDMGTGGGEKLLSFADALPPNTIATEGYPPNLPVARANLEAHGINVVPYDCGIDARLPFADNSLALVINRHEPYDALEVARILRPGGAFLTQQVDGRDLADILSVFGGESAYLHVNLATCQREVELAGLVVESAAEWAGTSSFSDIGALVYYLHAAPWNAPDDFSVERYVAQLLDLQHQRRPFTFTTRRFYIQARKPTQRTSTEP